jgi:hypothetical protein
MSVNEVMRRKASHGFFELNEYIKGLETEWKSNQGKVRGFVELPPRLDSDLY